MKDHLADYMGSNIAHALLCGANKDDVTWWRGSARDWESIATSWLVSFLLSAWGVAVNAAFMLWVSTTHDAALLIILPISGLAAIAGDSWWERIRASRYAQTRHLTAEILEALL